MSPYPYDRGGAENLVFPCCGRRAVVLCSGPPPSPYVLHYWLHGADLFVCTDAAGHPYDELPCTPDVVIGDFDSLAGRLLDGKLGPRYLQVVDQYTTDSEKAILFLVDQGFEEAVLLGAEGWRLDHTLFNCSLLERYSDKLRICLVGDETDTVRVGPGEHHSWDLPEGMAFSLMPLTGKVSGVTVEGAEYPLLGDTLETGGPATISNRIAMSPLLLSVGEGSLLVSFFRQLPPDDDDGILDRP